MEVSNKKLCEVFATSKRFIIPEFQRPYVWTKEEVEQLWNDLEGSYYDSIENGSSEDYFLGPLVISMQEDDKKNNLAFIVDGQQRITTLQTLLWLLNLKLQNLEIVDKDEILAEVQRLILTPSGKNSLLAVSARDQLNFNAIMVNSILDETTELGIAAKYLRSKVNLVPDNNLSGFFNFLQNRTRFIFVQTDSFSKAWELFIGLNGKGKPLNPADLIKAHICGTSDDSQQVADIWEQQVLPLGGDSTSAILDMCRAATGKNSTDAALFKFFEKTWNDGNINITKIGSGSISYERFWLHPIDDLSAIADNTKKYLRSLRSLSRRDVTPVLLALSERYGFDSIFTEGLLRLLDSYQLWMAICGKRGREQKFAELAYKIIINKNWTMDVCMVEFAKVITGQMPTKKLVYNSIIESSFRGRIMLHILKSYEEGMRGDVRIDDIWYEHIMPQTGTEYWFSVVGSDDKNLYSRIVNNLGNIAPLDPQTNIRGQNYAWDIKRELYQNEVPNWLISQIARDNDTWNWDKIKVRADIIANWSIDVRWPLDTIIENFEEQHELI